MKLKNVILTIAVFAFGLIAGNALSAGDVFDSPIYSDGYEFPAEIYSGLTGRAIERPSAGDHVAEKQILVYQDRVILDLQNVIFAKFTDTNSMDGTFDAESNALEIKPEHPNQVQEGDIIAYKNSCAGDGTIIHRVVKKGTDSEGDYWITKGDNNPKADPCKVRFNHIKGVVVALIF